MRLRVLIADDEPLAREGIKLMLSSDAEVIEARNGREAVTKIRDKKPDLVLLDIQMPRMDGFAVVKAVGADQMPAVIFVTAHDQYAIRAFEISAVDYLLKPVTEDRFRIAFERARSRISAARPDESTRQMLTVLDAIANPRRFLMGGKCGACFQIHSENLWAWQRAIATYRKVCAQHRSWAMANELKGCDLRKRIASTAVLIRKGQAPSARGI